MDKFFATDVKPMALKTKTEEGETLAEKYLKKVDDFLEMLFLELYEVMTAKLDPMIDYTIQYASMSKIYDYIESITQHKLKAMEML